MSKVSKARVSRLTHHLTSLSPHPSINPVMLSLPVGHRPIYPSGLSHVRITVFQSLGLLASTPAHMCSGHATASTTTALPKISPAHSEPPPGLTSQPGNTVSILVSVAMATCLSGLRETRPARMTGRRTGTACRSDSTNVGDNAQTLLSNYDIYFSLYIPLHPDREPGQKLGSHTVFACSLSLRPPRASSTLLSVPMHIRWYRRLSGLLQSQCGLRQCCFFALLSGLCTKLNLGLHASRKVKYKQACCGPVESEICVRRKTTSSVRLASSSPGQSPCGRCQPADHGNVACSCHGQQLHLIQ
ncbi:unnamed protein product [Protopolystoma xenopodis]|uniref:Uncharacterized protein n=1 Tax=Protopolystoma xenopodis TaxID=117903 RepID=A0A3S5FH37_9PLAT|nr:unnamed protein product [Protopolystoma xenopodis]